MKMEIGQYESLEDHSYYMSSDTLIIKFKRRPVVSNSFYNGGYVYTSSIINHSLNGKKDCGGKPLEYISNVIRNYNLSDETVALMTAVLPELFFYGFNEFGHVYLSLGLDNALNPLDDLGYPGYGTINIIVVLKNKIIGSAMLDLYKSIIELKSYFLFSHNIKSTKSDLSATGTFTDVLAIASGVNYPEITYSGTATKISNSISKTLYELFEEAYIHISKYKD